MIKISEVEGYILARYFILSLVNKNLKVDVNVLFESTVMAHTNTTLRKALSLCMTLTVNELGCIR